MLTSLVIMNNRRLHVHVLYYSLYLQVLLLFVSDQKLQAKIEQLERTEGHPHVGVVKSTSSREMQKIRRERDELREAVKGFETQMIQVNYVSIWCL